MASEGSVTKDILCLALGLLFAVWFVIAIWYRRRQKTLQSISDISKRIELHIGLGAESLKMAGGAAAIVGLALTAIELVHAQTSETNNLISNQLSSARALLDGSTVAQRVAGVQRLAALDAIEPSNRLERYRELLLRVHDWSPYESSRTAACLAGKLRLPTDADDLKLNDPPSVPITPPTEAVMHVLQAVGGATLLGRIDLRAVKLSQGEFAGMSFVGANLALSDLSGTNLADADLSGRADLFCANLYGSRLLGARLSGANMPGALLAGAALGPGSSARKTDLSGANLSGADLRNSFLCGLSFSGVNLENADLGGSIAYGADFRDATLTNTSFFDARLAGSSFEGAKFSSSALKPNFTCADLDGRSVSPTEICGSPGPSTHTFPLAKLPNEIRDRVTLCRTLIDGREEMRDCPPEKVACARDALPQTAQ